MDIFEPILLVLIGPLALFPGKFPPWVVFGGLLSKRDPQAALEAYLQSCYHGDSGANGCLGASRMAEKLGDPRAAIQYYRLSRYRGALQRADELEQMLAEQGGELP